MANRRLTKKQEKFAEEIAVKDISDRQAAINAGYSVGVAHVQAHENLNKPNIQARIEERKAECAKLAQVTREQIIGATVLRAFATIDDALDANGFLDIEKARETGAIHLIKKISKTHTQHGVNTAVEFYSNESAQDKLANYLGLEKAPQSNPEIETAIQTYRELINSGVSQKEALGQIVMGMAKLGFTVAEDDILNAKEVG